MKSKPPSPQRPYRQTARAAAAEATGERILGSFLKRLETQWFEDITLDSLAQDAGVTVQTVLRKFDGKAGILEAAHRHMGETISVRRTVIPGDVDRAVDVLTEDYQAVGDLVLRLLAQEERHEILKPIVDRGREEHRGWLAEVFAAELKPLTPARRTAMLDALVVATDIYIWKLFHLDMKRPVKAYKALVKRLLRAALSAQ